MGASAQIIKKGIVCTPRRRAGGIEGHRHPDDDPQRGEREQSHIDLFADHPHDGVPDRRAGNEKVDCQKDDRRFDQIGHVVSPLSRLALPMGPSEPRVPAEDGMGKAERLYGKEPIPSAYFGPWTGGGPASLPNPSQRPISQNRRLSTTLITRLVTIGK